MFSSHFGEFVALGTAICWTISAGSFEAAGKRVGSLPVNLIRLLLAFLFISGFNLFTRGMFLPFDATGSNWLWLTLSGIVGFVMGDLFLFQAYVEVGSRISMLIMAAVPPITAVTGFLIMGERMTWMDITGMLITLGGIALVILTKGPDRRMVKFSHPLKGLAFAFLGACGQAFGLVLSKLGMGSYNPFAATQIRIMAGIIGFAIVLTILKKWRQFSLAFKDGQALGHVTIGSFFGPFIGVSFSLLAVQYASTGVVSTITSLTPVLIIPVSIYIFKEKVKPKEVAGAIISLIGVALLFIH